MKPLKQQNKSVGMIEEIIKKTDYEKNDVCLVTISDAHLENDNSYGRYNSIGVNSDLENKSIILKESADVAGYIKCPLIFCGDLVDQRIVDGITLHHTSEFINYLNHHTQIPDFILLGGNHEYVDAAANFSTIKHYRYFVGDLDNRSKGSIATEVSQKIIQVKDKKVFFYCLPAHQQIDKHVVECIAWFKKNKKKIEADYFILLLHGGIEGADMGSLTFQGGIAAKLIEQCSQMFDWVICGDFHKFQYVNNHKNVYYCGAPKQMNLGDIGQKRGYQILNLTKGTLNFIKSKSPTFKIIEIVCGEYTHPYIKNPEKYTEKLKNKIFNIKITGTSEEINLIDFNGIKDSMMKNGAVGVYKDPQQIREKRNSTVISKDLPVSEIITTYVQNKDYDQDEKVIKHHISVLKKYTENNNEL